MIQTIQVPSEPTPGGHYSYATVHAGTVYVSGLLPISQDGSTDAALPFAHQVQVVLARLDAVLHAAGSSREHLLKVTVYLTDIAHWPEFNRLYALHMGTHKPARAVVPVPQLHFGFALELDAIAAVAA